LGDFIQQFLWHPTNSGVDLSNEPLWKEAKCAKF
jgi:hypothetical protein